MKTRVHILVFLTAVMLATLLVSGCQDKESMAIAEDESPGAPAIPVSILIVKPAAMRDVIFLPGETEAYEDVKVAANTAGRVEWVGPREGQKVNKGDLLIKIDVSALKASMEHAQAAY